MPSSSVRGTGPASAGGGQIRTYIPGPQAHAMKLGFETYFLWKARHGYVQLP